MYPILARTRWFFIYSYTVVLALGLLVSVGLIYWQGRKTAVSVWLDGILFGLAGSLIGGRIIFLILEWGYYSERGEGIGNLWQGGLNFHGAVIGAFLGVLIGARVQKRQFFPFLQQISLTVPLLFLFGWGACWLEGCAYGVETTLGPFSANLPDHLGIFAVRYQTQLAGMLLSGLIFLFGLWFMNKSLTINGRIFPILTGLSFLNHALISLLRGDEAFLISTVRLDIILNLGIVVFCLILLQYGRGAHDNR
ncbi:MAG: prolipoprotein diacylglyceryl transferase family protein [Chloroflexota bacterium]